MDARACLYQGALLGSRAGMPAAGLERRFTPRLAIAWRSRGPEGRRRPGTSVVAQFPYLLLTVLGDTDSVVTLPVAKRFFFLAKCRK